MVPKPSRAAACLTIAALALTLGACAFPSVKIKATPDDLTILQGQDATVSLATGPAECPDDSPIPCVDVSGRTFEYVLQNLPAGVTCTFDHSLRSPTTPGLSKVTFHVAANAEPAVDFVVIHAVLDGRSLGFTEFQLRIVPAATATTAAPVSIAAVGTTAVVALSDGTVMTWGEGLEGELGLGNRTRATVPTAVPGLTNVRAVAAGGHHVLALTGDGRVLGWGRNDRGQLGTRPRRTHEWFDTPTLVAGVQNIQAIVAGDEHSMALDANGVVWTWGDYADHEFAGDAPPTPIPNLPPIRDMAAGAGRSFAVDVNGAVWWWSFFANQPQQMPGLSDIQAIESTADTRFVVDRNGAAWSWGESRGGMLGDGTDTDDFRLQPALISGLSDVASIDAGVIQVTALTRTGTVWEWGGRRLTPVPVPLTDVRAVASGSERGLALLACGAVWSWGRDELAPPGENTTSNAPRAVPGIGDDSLCPRVSLHATVSGVAGMEVLNIIHAEPRLFIHTRSESAGVYDRGTTVTLDADSAIVDLSGVLGTQRWTFERWALDCTGTDPTTTVVLDRSKRCAAVYRDPDRPLSLLTVFSDGGTVTGEGGSVPGAEEIHCPGQCHAVFDTGATAVLHAADGNGFGFTEWVGDCSGTALDTQVTMSGAKTCGALFRPFDLAIAVTGQGTVFSDDTAFECGGTCTFQPQRAQATLVAAPAPGHRLDAWGGDCTGAGATASVAMTADRACTASFSRDPNFFFLTMVVDGIGSVRSFPPGIECSATCVLLLPAGAAYDVLALDTPQSVVSEWLDECPAGAVPMNQVVIDRDKTCRVRFTGRPTVPVASMFVLPPSPRLGQITRFSGASSHVFDPATNTQHPELITGFSWDLESDGAFEVSGDRTDARGIDHAFQTTGPRDVRLVVEGGPPGATDDTVEIVDVLPSTEPLFGLIMNKAGAGHGTVHSLPRGLFHCAEPCNAAALQLEAGQSVVLKATPDAVSQFVGWSGCDSISPGGTECTVDINADRAVTANFDPIANTYTLTVIINAPAGSTGVIIGSATGNVINCLAAGGPGSVCSQAFAPGTVTQVRPGGGEGGATFAGWVSGCDSITGASRCNVTMNSNRTVVASFVP